MYWFDLNQPVIKIHYPPTTHPWMGLGQWSRLQQYGFKSNRVWEAYVAERHLCPWEPFCVCFSVSFTPHPSSPPPNRDTDNACLSTLSSSLWIKNQETKVQRALDQVIHWYKERNITFWYLKMGNFTCSSELDRNISHWLQVERSVLITYYEHVLNNRSLGFS